MIKIEIDDEQATEMVVKILKGDMKIVKENGNKVMAKAIEDALSYYETPSQTKLRMKYQWQKDGSLK